MALGVGAVAGAVNVLPGVMEPQPRRRAGRACHSPDDCFDCWHRGRGGEALYAKRRQRDDIGENTDENVIEDCDLRGGRDRGISCDGHPARRQDLRREWRRGDVVGLRGGAGGDALAGRRSDDAELSDGGIAPEIPLTLQMMEDPMVPFSVTVSVTR